MQYSFSKFLACRCNSVVLSSKVRRKRKKKKESGDSSESGICNCGLPAHCSQPAVAGSVIYADLWGELSTHLVPQALFVQSSPVWEPLLQAFPFPSTGKGDTAPTLSGLRVYLQFMWEVGLPSSPVEFSSLCHSDKLPCSWLLGTRPAPSRGSPAHLACLFTVPGRIPFPQSSALRAPHPLSCVP
jgi:hypothetical protein